MAAAAWAVAAAIVIGFGGGLWAPLDAPGHFRLHLAIVAAALGPPCFALGRRRAAVAAVAAAAVGLAGLGPALAPAARPALAAQTVPLVVAVANVDIHNPNPAAAAQALAALDADVLVTLETIKGFGGAEPLLRDRYPHVVDRVVWVYTGNWLWSRSAVSEGFKQDGDADSPDLVFGRIAVAPGSTVEVFGLHLRRPLVEPQTRQLAALATANPREGPRIVVGDFNAAPWSAAVAQASRSLDVAPVGGLRPSWRLRGVERLGLLSGALSLPLDHILVSEDVGVDWVRRFSIPGSDHDGVIAQLQVPLAPEPTASATDAKPSRASSASSPVAMRAPRLTPP